MWSSHPSISRALVASCLRVSSIPAWTSPIETAEMNNCSSRLWFNHSTTPPCGRNFRSSDITLVSSRYLSTQNSTGFRNFVLLRSGTSASVRPVDAKSHSFRDGRAFRCNRSHSSTGTRNGGSNSSASNNLRSVLQYFF